MAITKDTAPSAHPSTTEAPKERSPRKRMHAVLEEAQERYRHELMDEEERCLLRDRIIRLKTPAGVFVIRATLSGLVFAGPALLVVLFWPV